MKDIVIAIVSALSGSLVTFTITANHYSRKIYDKNIFQRIFSIVNFGNNIYNDEKAINDIVKKNTKDNTRVFYGDEKPENAKKRDIWITSKDK